ncbi:MAG: PD40 domain-containing protein [Acidobacteria bacterium]|nr:PD40 domain-containing protein [Acidobacteriota bacterium]
MNSAASAEPLEPGRRLGPYEIQSSLGRGGMGQVYQALDHRLNRLVALKILAGEESGNALREAQAASALNHPNIVTVYEIGYAEGLEYIAMERVEGENIARRGSRLSSRDALRYAIQIADALAAAHAAGIVHRDLKPGNLMVTPRGLVKVLDFGIAKMTAPPASSDEITRTITSPGRVIGTFSYMSPEQAEGKDVDTRSDIFSFGCVLYELLTGHRAFDGESTVATLAAVLAREPRPVHELSPDLPAPIARIIENCLRKKREERWQSIGDVKLMLESALADLSAAPASPPARRFSIPIAALVAAAALAGALAAWFLARTPPAKPEHARLLGQVTLGSGLSMAPAISTGGQLLAWASDRAGQGNLDIWVQQVGAADPLRLTTGPEDDTDPAISPDGTRVAFRSERGGGGVYIVPTMGGEPVLFAPRGRKPRYSPDGRWIAYWEGRESGGLLPGSAKVFVVEAGGGQPRQLGAELAAALYPVWSPDSQSLVVLARGLKDKDADWWLLRPDGRPQPTHALEAMRKQGLERVAWQRQIIPLAWGAGGVLFTSNRYDAGNLWQIPLPPGIATPVTRGPGYHLQASLSAGGALAFASLEWHNEIWSLPVDADRGVARGDIQPLTPDESDALAPSISRDGARLVYRARFLDRFAIRSRDMASEKRMSLVEGRDMYIPRIAGNTVVYCDSSGNIYQAGALGGAVERVCAACGYTLGISPDATRVVFENIANEALAVLDLRTRAKSAPIAPLAGAVLSGAQYSPDGKWLAFDARSFHSTAQIFVVPADSPQPLPRERWLAVTPGTAEDVEPAWSPGGGLLYYLSDRDGFRCIWARRLDPASKTPQGDEFAVQHFHSARRSLRRILGNGGYPGLSAAPGRLVFSFGELTGNIWLER